MQTGIDLMGEQYIHDHAVTNLFKKKTYSSNFLELFSREIRKDVALWGAEDLEGNSAVVVLQGGHVVVPEKADSNYGCFLIVNIQMTLQH